MEGLAVYQTDIDYDKLLSLDHDGVINYAMEYFNTEPLASGISFQQMAKIVKSMSNILGLELDNEQLLFVIANVKRLLCESCAGSGKTTMSQMCILRYKMIEKLPPEKILCLAYNSNAVKDMTERHSSMVGVLNRHLISLHERMVKKGIKSPLSKPETIDPRLKCSTFHALCRVWVKEYATKLALDPNTFLLDGEASDTLFKTVVRQWLIQNKSDFRPNSVLESDLLQAYMYTRETLCRDNTKVWMRRISPQFTRNLKSGDILQIFELYDRFKKIKHKLDFADLIDTFYKLLTNPEICARFRRNFSVILVDEYQDITPNMLRCIKLVAEGDPALGIERYSDLRLICVGDTDQSIYGYRGTDPYNCIRFRKDYASAGQLDAKIASMSVNRRCAKEVIDIARRVIQSNAERIDKPIRGVRMGGEVTFDYYRTLPDETSMILKYLRSIPQNEWFDTCICFRNNASARAISTALFEEGIATSALKQGYAVFSDPVSLLVQGVSDLYAFPTSKKFLKDVLFKIYRFDRSVTRKTLDTIIDDLPEDLSLIELTDPRKNHKYHQTFRTPAVQHLIDGYRPFKRSDQLNNYMPAIFEDMKIHDWAFLDHCNNAEREFYFYMISYYSRAVTYSDLLDTQNEMLAKLYEEQRLDRSVTLSTFHGLKGLEFKHVIIADLDDAVFPGSDIPFGRDVDSTEIALAEKEALRLFYVALTRAKDSLYLLFAKQQPCRYNSFVDGGIKVAAPDVSTLVAQPVAELTTKSVGGFELNDFDATALTADNMLNGHTPLAIAKEGGISTTAVQLPETRSTITPSTSTSQKDVTDALDNLDDFEDISELFIQADQLPPWIANKPELIDHKIEISALSTETLKGLNDAAPSRTSMNLQKSMSPFLPNDLSGLSREMAAKVVVAEAMGVNAAVVSSKPSVIISKPEAPDLGPGVNPLIRAIAAQPSSEIRSSTELEDALNELSDTDDVAILAASDEASEQPVIKRNPLAEIAPQYSVPVGDGSLEGFLSPENIQQLEKSPRLGKTIHQMVETLRKRTGSSEGVGN